MSRQRQAILRVLALEEEDKNKKIDDAPKDTSQNVIDLQEKTTSDESVVTPDVVVDEKIGVVEQPTKKKSPFPPKKKKVVPQE